MYVPTATKNGQSRLFRSLPVWWLAFRPATLWAAVAPVCMGGALGYFYGSRDYGLFALILITTILIQIATNLANDLIDAGKGTDTDRRVGPVRVVQSGLLTDEAVKKALVYTLTAAVLLGLILVLEGGVPILCIGVAALICTLWYSAGPAALSYSGLADFFVLFFFGPIAVSGTVYLLTGAWQADALLAGMALGLIAVALLVSNNLRDFWTDKNADKNTLVVRFGLTFGRIEYTVCLVMACLIPLLASERVGIAPYFGACAFFAVIPLVYKVWTAAVAEDFLKLLAPTAKLLLLYAGLFSIGLFFP